MKCNRCKAQIDRPHAAKFCQECGYPAHKEFRIPPRSADVIEIMVKELKANGYECDPKRGIYANYKTQMFVSVDQMRLAALRDDITLARPQRFSDLKLAGLYTCDVYGATSLNYDSTLADRLFRVPTHHHNSR
jgi:hypothetical protein